MDDIRPARLPRPTVAPTQTTTPTDLSRPTAANEQAIEASAAKTSTRPWYRVRPGRHHGFLASVIAIVSLAVLAMFYQAALRPVADAATHEIRITIAPGETPGQIARKLDDKQIIRSAAAFRIHATVTGNENKLKAGSFNLSPSLSTPEVVNMLASGENNPLNVTILPEQSLFQLKTALLSYGFSADEIDGALAATDYDSDLLASRPAGTSLEGYLYPETYQLDSDGTVHDLFQRALDQFARVTRENRISERLTARGFTFFQGVTLASILEKEVPSLHDRRQASQVFQKRLAEGIVLGSDVTYIYGGRLLGVDNPTPELDSPYNTRKNAGLPPGPISNVSLETLVAVIDPAPGDYLYFVAGDGEHKGKTFFSRTEQEHEANKHKYCSELCQ